MSSARFPKSPISLPEARSGDFAIVHTTYPAGTPFDLVSRREAILTGQKAEQVTLDAPHVIRRLTGPDGVWMSDLPVEIRQMAAFVKRARGHVLIGGLGLGIVARLAAANPRVIDVTVVELERDVINLCGAGLGPKVEVVRADLTEYLRGVPHWMFDTAFLDTWQATGEMEWASTVAPLRRIIRNRFGKRRVECWAEDVMFGQLARSFARASGYPLEQCRFSPAHYAFRAATIALFPERPEPQSHQEVFDEIIRGERMIANSPAFREALGHFLAEVGSARWERAFGRHWDECEARARLAAGGA